MKTLRLIIMFLLCLGFSAVVWQTNVWPHEFEAGEVFNKSELIEMDEYRWKQDQFIGELRFFGVLTEEEEEDINEISKPELGHFFGSHVASAENDEDRYDYHMEKREELMDEMEVLLDKVKERLEAAMPPPAESEAPQQGL